MQPRELAWLRAHVWQHASVSLSKAAQQRLKWFDYYEQHQRNAALACRYFGISRQTFYRWHRRFDRQALTSLEGRSHAPRRRRTPTWTTAQAQAVLQWRRRFPRWGKDKLAVLVRGQGHRLSASMVGRILAQAIRRGVLVESPRVAVGGLRRTTAPRPYACRKPASYRAIAPGDLVEVDTLDLRPVPGVILKHFTARDVISRWDVLEAHRRATSTAAARFLRTLRTRCPFPVRAVQVDGGSEFAAAFEVACRAAGIHLFVLPPRSPKLNGAVERAHRTHTEEFYQVMPFALELRTLNRQLVTWERIYNTLRPHQALGYLTPAAFLAQWQAAHPDCH